VIDVFVEKLVAPSLMISDPDPSPDDVDVRWDADRAKNSSVVVVDKEPRWHELMKDLWIVDKEVKEDAKV
jgi:hypothetical protein